MSKTYREQVEALGTIVRATGHTQVDLITRDSALAFAAEADAEIARLTAERDAAREERDRYRNGNTALLEALMDMANQYMGRDDGTVDHMFMSAGENCCELLENAGVAEETPRGCRLNWQAIEDRKTKENQA